MDNREGWISMDKKRKIELFEYKIGNTLPFGVTKVSDGVQFAVFLPDKKQCFLNLYQKGKKKPDCRIELSHEYKRGSVYFITVTQSRNNSDSRTIAQILSQDYEYTYEADGEEFVDPYAAVVYGREKWGRRREGKRGKLRGGISLEEFDWQEDCQPGIEYSDLILYQLHVRGYTRHISSKVAHRGTFDGLREKIPHLKDLGVNGILLLPCYEFDEIQSGGKKALGEPEYLKSGKPDKEGKKEEDAGKHAVLAGQQNPAGAREVEEPVKLNYWGYGSTDSYYFAPKASYAADGGNAAREMKELVRDMHRAGIEVLLDIYFSPGTNVCLMEDCLRNWVLEYHVDGFRVNQEVMPSLVLVSDPLLSGVKLLASYWDTGALRQAGVLRKDNALAEYNEGFMVCARRFLKSDEGQVESFANYFRRNADDHAVINFMAHVNGLTMMDLVSYDVKHNGANGEKNQDGTQYNYSWNCGIEGKTRKKNILSRRMCQIRNAFLMMLLGQGTPMILAGDEFGNSQSGNNNPYCQDNAITWLDWKQLQGNREIFDYVKKLIAFRKEHPVLHQGKELHLFDTLSCGMPDLSIHGTQAWRSDFSYYSRMLALLFYGEYQKREDGTPDDSIYIIFNMYWESKSFDLPQLPDGREWYPAIETYDNTFSEIPKPVKKKRKTRKTSLECQKKTVVPPRSIVVFIGR